MIPAYYEFANPAKICSGRGALENIPYELKMLGGHCPMILSDNTLKKLGLLDLLLKAMPEVPIGRVYTDIPTDSSVETVNQIAREYRAYGCDSIIALGGGSVLDTAKGLKLVISQHTDQLLDLMGCDCIPAGHRVPFIAIPTTAGTGSEATAVAVIKNNEKRIKMEFISDVVLPDVAVLDPRMTMGLPPRTTASTGFDTLCHAIEAYSCLQKNPVSDVYALTAISLVAQNLTRAVKNGRDQDARCGMANASYLAGSAFSNSMVGIVHAIGHALGSIAHVPHGEAMAILLPVCMRYNLRYCRETYSRILLELEGPEVYSRTPEKDRAKAAAVSVKRLANRLHRLSGMPVTLAQAGVDETQFGEIARVAVDDGAMIVNPRPAGYEDVIRILEAVRG